jgi:DNA-binding transcriptional ArsR family regulator
MGKRLSSWDDRRCFGQFIEIITGYGGAFLPSRITHHASHRHSQYPEDPFFHNFYLSIDLIKYSIYHTSMDVFSALAEPTRRQIMEMLAQRGELSATEIYDQFPVSRPAVSQHLKVLREAKLVQVEKRAQQRIYRINPPAVLAVEAWAKNLAELWQQRFDALDAWLKAEQKKISDKENEQ